ncbi:hypothetical protein HID58_066201 [Brassica napus]|uniref:Uncharacterized protein n=1 Tax=Brassica napus TaxID=3708 RepID=A0ABQ7ZEZ8_BRANA|nr:hypothetical protein HID58_066201 [Brassica napus]
MYEFVGLLGFRVRLLEINQVLESIRQAFHHQLHKLDKDYSESLRCLVQPRNLPFPFSLSYFVIMGQVMVAVESVIPPIVGIYVPPIFPTLAAEESEKGCKKDKFIQTRLHAFWNMELGRQLRMRLVSNKSYPTVQTTLNNEQDWRNGLRVKLLEHARKFARRILTMKEVDPEKDNTGRVHGQTKGEENKNSNEHHHHRHHHPDTSVDIVKVDLTDSTNNSQCSDGFKLFKIIYHGPNSCSSSRRLPLRLEASDTIFTFDMLKSFVTVA